MGIKMKNGESVESGIMDRSRQAGVSFLGDEKAEFCVEEVGGAFEAQMRDPRHT